MSMRQAPPASSSAAYEFTQAPSAVPHRRAPYRDPSAQIEPRPANIMFDRRVFRGNTYASQILPPSAQAEAERLQREREGRRLKRESQRKKRIDDTRSRTPPPISGRAHMDVQTESYLEELSDEVPQEDIATQTDPLLDRPPSPMFIPAKSGVDRSTQIEEGELFDFNLEVEPILEILVGRSLEQGLMEVLEEEEIENIRQHQTEFEQIRNAELAEVQRMESEAKRKEDEKQRRMKQHKERVQREEAIKKKVAAAAFARRYLRTVRQAVFDRLLLSGHFADPLAREVEEQFLPDVLSSAISIADQRTNAMSLVDELIASAIMRQHTVQQADIEAQEQKHQEAKQADDEKQARRTNRRQMKVEDQEGRIMRQKYAEQAEADDADEDEEDDE